MKKPTEKFQIRFLATTFTILTIFAALSPIILREGWPMNHEWWSFFDRIRIYSLHYKVLDFVPIWSTHDVYGLGSPLPAFYHKLFYYPAGIIYLVTDDMKLAVLLTIGIFLSIGCYGTYKVGKQLGLTTKASVLFANSVVFLNYTISNWLVRGAMAEFSATMIIPFLIFWCIRFLEYKKFEYWIAYVLIVLYLAHSVIAYYSIFAVIVAVIINIVRNFNVTFILETLKKGTLSALIFFGILSLYFIPMSVYSSHYDISKIVGENTNLSPAHQFIAFHKYFFDPQYTWQERWDDLTVQFDLIILATTIVVLVFLWFQRNRGKGGTKLGAYVLIFMLITNLFYILLQFKFMNFFYESVPGAIFIQFPWRLLSFIQFLNLFILLFFVGRLKNVIIRNPQNYVALVVFVFLFARYPVFRRFQYDWFPKEIFNGGPYYGTFGIGEYAPDLEQIPPWFFTSVNSHFSDLAEKGVTIKKGNCSVSQKGNFEHEQMQIEYEVNCLKPSLAAFPHNFSGLEIVETSSDEINKNINWFRTNLDPRLHVNLPQGKYILSIEFPRLSHLLKQRNTAPMMKEKLIYDEVNVFDFDKITVDSLWFLSNLSDSIPIDVEQCKTQGLSGENSVMFTEHKDTLLKKELKRVKIADIYEISFFKRSETNNVALIIEDDSKRFRYEVSAGNGNLIKGWEQIDFKFYIPDNLLHSKFFIYFNKSGNDTIYMDDLEIRKWK